MLELVVALCVASPGEAAGPSGEPAGRPVDVPVLVIEDAAAVVPEAVEEAGPWAARMFGRLDERLTGDLSWLEYEPVFQARTTLSLGMRVEPEAAWSFEVEGRLRHRLVARDGAPAGGEAWSARFEPELRRLMVVHRPECGPEVEVGLGVVRWGRTTLARPLDLVSPEDWRDGPFTPIEERRLPVVSAAARFAVGAGVLEARYVPFFVAQRAPLTGESAPELPVGAGLDGGLDGRLEDLADVAGPRQDFVSSGELGLRLTQRWGELDVGLSWLWRRDRVPGPSGHGRQHVVGVDLGLRLGAVGLVGEVAVASERRLVRPDLSTEGYFGVDWALELRLQPAIFLDVVVGLSGRHSPGASGAYLADGRDVVWFDYSVAMMLAFDGRLRLSADGRVGSVREGQHARVGLFLRASDALELGLGVLVASGRREVHTLAALYRETSHAWLEVVWAF